ncbi:hypothetical protein [Nonomuraea sp. NPDC050202]|uniref:hypothetical protein n=1 Tax=Nonomuraea sp. NPDC050202 TaxID=3155035 RepID=UPI0033CB9733
MRADNFTQVSNDLARDRRISRRARGLFVELASHQEGWMTSIAALVELGPEGVHAIRSAIEELEKYGYLVRIQRRDAKGRLGETEYWITDCPEEYQEEKPSAEPSSENRTTGDAESSPSSEPSSDFPTSGEPRAGEPRAEDRTHKKTNHKKTNERNQEMPPSSASPAGEAQQQDLLGGDRPPAASSKKTSRSSKPKKERSPEEQLRFEQATKVAQWWWDQCDEAGVPKIGRSANGTGFPGLVKMLETALADNYTQREIADALRSKRKRFPQLSVFEDALMEVRGIAPVRTLNRSHTPGNHLAPYDPDDAANEQNRQAWG